MSFKLTVPRGCKLGVWHEESNGRSNFGSEILPLSPSGVEVAITNGHAAAFVRCNGSGDLPQHINPQTFVVTGGRGQTVVESLAPGVVKKSYESKTGPQSDAFADHHRNVDIIGIIPDITGSPLASIEIDPKQLAEICKAIGHKSGTVRLTFAIQQVPFIQYGMAEWAEMNRPDVAWLAEALNKMLADNGLVGSGITYYGVVFEHDSWVPYYSSWSRTSDGYTHNYWVHVDNTVTDTAQIAQLLVEEYDRRQMDRHLAVPKPKTSCLVTSSDTDNFGCLMPNNSQTDIRQTSFAIRRITERIERLKQQKKDLLEKIAQAEAELEAQPF